MISIKDTRLKYWEKIDPLDLELIISHAIKKSREFVLAHPEYKLSELKIKNLKLKIARRAKKEPLAYILGKKEFFGLEFKVNKNVLIPRPETELLVEEVLKLKPKNKIIIDIGTGSGNIIIALAKKLKNAGGLIAIDISEKALRVAKQNAKIHGVDKRVKFLKGSLLDPLIGNCLPASTRLWQAGKLEIGNSRILILANLPYLSKKIYASASKDIKKYEPRLALLSRKDGLSHYEKLLKQIRILKNQCSLFHVTCFMEISPEQKKRLGKLIRDVFPAAKIAFHKDLAGKWRVCEIIFRA